MAEVRINETQDMEKFFTELPVAVRNKYAKKAVKAAGKIYIGDLRKRVPESRKTGTADKQSASVKSKRSGKKPLKQLIKQVVREYDGGITISVAGASWPDGAHYHLVDGDHEHVAWGRRTGATLHGKQFVAAAIDTTQDQQHQAVVQTLKDGIIAEGG